MSDRIEPDFTHQALTGKIIGACYRAYSELGYGFLESVYEKAVALLLQAQGIQVERQAPLSVWFLGQEIGKFRADLVVERCVILELKAGRALESAHEAQLLNALKATNIEVGLLFNFGPKPQLRRLAFSNSRKNCVHQRSSAAKQSLPATDP